MKFFRRILLILLAAGIIFPLSAQDRKYDDNDIKRILYLKQPPSSSPVRYAVLEKIISSKQLECTYLGTQQKFRINPDHVTPMIFYEDSSNFMITQYALFGIFSRQKNNLALGLAKINNDTTGRMNILSSFAAAVKDIKNNISTIHKKYPANLQEQSDALADLISKDKTLSLIKKAASSHDWVLALTLFEIYKTDVMPLYTRNFSNMADVIKEVQTVYTECENELLLNLANQIQNSNVRRTQFLNLYPKARGVWSQTPPNSYAQLRNVFIRSMKSYHNLDKISKIFKPQDWGSAMLDALLLLEGAPCAEELEREFDDEMRRLIKRSQRH